MNNEIAQILSGKKRKVLIAGFGREAKSVIRFIKTNVKEEEIFIFDSKKVTLEEEFLKLPVYFGDSNILNVPEVDVIIRSPGFPKQKLHLYLEKFPNIILSSSTEMFLEKHRDKTIGITGTKGKSTTSSLIALLLKNAGYKVELVGNIGLPAIDKYYSEVDYFVYELSSFQLDDLKVSPHIAVFLNIFEEHLDYHESFENYLNAKAKIFSNQKINDSLFLSHGSTITECIKDLPSNVNLFGDTKYSSWIEQDYFYSRSESGVVKRLFGVNDTNLKGGGNQQNILAVISLAVSLNIDTDILIKSILEFKPLPHRLEFVAEVGNVTFINDSISTVPQASINAIEAYRDNISTIILGGVDRGVDFSMFGRYLAATNISNFILFPVSGQKIANFIESHLSSDRLGIVKFLNVDNMADAVKIAKSVSLPNSVCLLSPASPSFNLFKNFEERGEEFKKEVLKK